MNGKRKVVEKGGFATEKEAYRAGVEKYTDFMHGNIGITSEAITVRDFMNQWLNEVVALNVKATSLQTYKFTFQSYICPYLGETRVQELTPVMLDKWLRSLQKLGLSFNTISAAHALISHALDYAVHPSRLISSNSASYIKVPKNAPKNIVKRTIITPERFQALLAKYPFGTPMYIPLLLLYYTGMRLGEVLGLSWSDINFATKRINLSQQIIYIKKSGYFLTSLKTKSSERYIIVEDYLLSELQRWQAQQVENEKQFGGTYVYTYLESDGHIIRRSKGLPAPNSGKISLICVQNNGQLVLKNFVIKRLIEAGLNAHSFRHTHATQLIENGATAKGVAGRLGHANTLITQNLYTHNTLKLQEETAAIFAKILQTNS